MRQNLDNCYIWKMRMGVEFFAFFFYVYWRNEYVNLDNAAAT